MALKDDIKNIYNVLFCFRYHKKMSDSNLEF